MTTSSFQGLRKYSIRLGLLAGAAFFLTVTASQAGFEWVPAPKSPEPSTLPAPVDNDSFLPAPEPEPAPLLEETQVLSEPQVLTAPQPEPELMPVAPQQPEIMAENPTLIEPEPAPEPVMRTKSFAPPPEFEPGEQAVAAETAEQTAQSEELTAPPIVKTRVIVPDDAPDSAKEKLPSLEISPTPLQDMGDPEMTDNSMAPAVTEQPASDPVTTYGEYETAEGFGNDIALAIALTEIVPPGYSYSFGEAVNPGLKVSWNGGQAWPDVIQTMIAPLDLRMEIRGNMVFIGTKSLSALMPNDIEAPVKPADGNAPELASAEPQPLMNAEQDSSPRRMIIEDPGETSSNQPSQTMTMIKETQTLDAHEDVSPSEMIELTEGETSIEPPAAREELEMTATTIYRSEDLKSLDKQMMEETIAMSSDPEKETVIFEEASAEEEIETAMIASQVEPAAAQAVKIKTLWEAQKGDSLKRTLDQWSQKANYELQWESPHDYTIDSDVMVTGDLQRAIKTVFNEAINSDETPMLTFIAARHEGERGKILIRGDQKS